MSSFLSGDEEENPHDITEGDDFAQCKLCGKKVTSKRKLKLTKCNGGTD